MGEKDDVINQQKMEETKMLKFREQA